MVTCAVGIGPREAGGFGLVVDLEIEDPSLPKAELEQFVREAHEKVCPYSHATRDNVAVTLSVVGA
jgi:organic hydroperoxide reductase OsmC/OhrA